MTATGQLADGTATLAALLRTDRDLRELAAAGDWAAIRGHFPRAAVAVDAVLRRVGHRGPGEAELANPTTIESPSQLLVAAARAADTEPQTPFATGRAPLPLRVAQTVGRSRALAWDTTMCYTQQLRMALRERGRRLAAARVLARADDIFYLTIAEAIAPPVDTRLRVTRRRAERVRLQALNMPEVIDGYWSALPDPAPEQPMPAEDRACVRVRTGGLRLDATGQVNSAGSTGLRDLTNSLMSSSPAQMLTFMPASTRF